VFPDARSRSRCKPKNPKSSEIDPVSHVRVPYPRPSGLPQLQHLFRSTLQISRMPYIARGRGSHEHDKTPKHQKHQKQHQNPRTQQRSALDQVLERSSIHERRYKERTFCICHRKDLTRNLASWEVQLFDFFDTLLAAIPRATRPLHTAAVDYIWYRTMTVGLQGVYEI